MLAEHGRRPGRYRDATRRRDAVVGTPFLDEALILVDAEHMTTVMARLGLVEHEAAAIMLNDPLKRRADGGEHGVHVEVRHHRVVHFEQQLQPIALARELHLRGTSALVVQNVVDCHGDLLARPPA